MNRDVDVNFYVLLGYNQNTKFKIKEFYKKNRQTIYVLDFIPHLYMTKFHHFKYFRLNKTDYDDILQKEIYSILSKIDEDKHIVLVPCDRYFYDFVVRNKQVFECLCVLDTNYFLARG